MRLHLPFLSRRGADDEPEDAAWADADAPDATAAPDDAAPPGPPAPPPEPAESPDAARLAMLALLWGEGFARPGGGAEVLRLIKPTGLTATMSLLLLGAGAGGPGRAIADAFGAWITACDTDPALVAAAALPVARPRPAHKRVTTELWSQAAPEFRAGFYNAVLALEPLAGTPPAPVLTALARALKPGGHIVLTELVAAPGLDAGDPSVAAWMRLEGRGADTPSADALTDALTRLRFDVRIAEDETGRHVAQVMQGWQEAVRAIAARRPARPRAAALVREAERWLLRLRLLDSGALRLMRWYAIRGA